MFKKRHVKKIQDEIDDHMLWLKSFTKDTEKIREHIFYDISSQRDSSDVDWDNLVKNKEVRESLYQLMLHRQFIGYSAESIRKLTMKRMKIEGTAPSPFDKSSYSKLIEHGSATKEMELIFELFLEELQPVYEKYYREVFDD